VELGRGGNGGQLGREEREGRDATTHVSVSVDDLTRMVIRGRRRDLAKALLRRVFDSSLETETTTSTTKEYFSFTFKSAAIQSRTVGENSDLEKS